MSNLRVRDIFKIVMVLMVTLGGMDPGSADRNQFKNCVEPPPQKHQIYAFAEEMLL